MRLAVTFLSLVVCLLPAACPCADEIKLDTAKIDAALGAKGALNKDEGVFKVSFPRSDVKVVVDGTTMPPFMGLTSWAAFKDGVKVEAMVMGDIVLFQD